MVSSVDGAETRTALVTMPVVTKADAIAGLDVIEHSMDGVFLGVI